MPADVDPVQAVVVASPLKLEPALLSSYVAPFASLRAGSRASHKTAIWFDTKRNTYLLPIKAEIRNEECIDVLNHSTLAERRPVDDPDRIAIMLANADLIVLLLIIILL